MKKCTKKSMKLCNIMPYRRRIVSLFAYFNIKNEYYNNS